MAYYEYMPPDRKPPQKQDGSDVGYWILVVVWFLVGAWPLALLMLYLKLTRDKTLDRVRAKLRAKKAARQRRAGREAAAAAAPRSAKDTSMRQPKKGKALTVIGGILAGIGLFASAQLLVDMISYGYYGYEMAEMLQMLALAVGGGFMFHSGRSIRKKARRTRQYASAIKDQRVVRLQTLAAITGVSQRRLIHDLEDMIEDGMLPHETYIDHQNGCLVLDAEAMPYHNEAERILVQEEEPAAAEADSEGEYEQILSRIRTANDKILDDAMSAKIDHIESITRSIFDIVKQKPERRQEIRSFFNYYLPTTLKLLNFYAQLEAQPVQSQTIADSRRNIEGIMDNLSQGFESQLDSLFRADALDISSDISVLENMLAQDGLAAMPGEDAITKAARGGAQTAARRMGGSAAAVMRAPEDE